MIETAYIGVGSNINPGKNVTDAFRLLSETVSITGISTFYVTEPLMGKKQPRFLNGVWRIETDLDAHSLKKTVLSDIESKLGRIRTGDPYESRTIDLDILIFGDAVIDEDGFTIPDRDILTRVFVAAPLLELAPDMVLPGDGKSLKSIVDEMDITGMKKELIITNLMRGLL